MLSLYEILKASKTGIAPDMWTALAGANFGGVGSGAEVKEITGIPPLSFTANGQPLLDYLISGNMSQSGTPTPQNPVMPEGCGERTGNLFDKDANDTAKGYVLNEYLRVNGETTSSNGWRISEYIEINERALYTLDYKGSYNAPSVCFYDNNKNFISGAAYSGRLIIPIGTPKGTKYCRFSFRDTGKENIMFNEGSTALPYEPYGIKIPISSANTTTPVYLGEVETTRRIKKLVFDGTETGWRKGPTFFFNQELSPDYLRASNSITCMCSRYPAYQQVGSGADVPEGYCSLYYAPEVQRFYIKDNNFATLEDFTTYLAQQYAAGTPVTVWYVLATPETAVVNEPLMKIGDYADEVSNAATIPTNNGSTTIDVLTDVKPSEIYIKYKGV